MMQDTYFFPVYPCNYWLQITSQFSSIFTHQYISPRERCLGGRPWTHFNRRKLQFRDMYRLFVVCRPSDGRCPSSVVKLPDRRCLHCVMLALPRTSNIVDHLPAERSSDVNFSLNLSIGLLQPVTRVR
jgi:hypothetical protein